MKSKKERHRRKLGKENLQDLHQWVWERSVTPLRLWPDVAMNLKECGTAWRRWRAEDKDDFIRAC